MTTIAFGTYTSPQIYTGMSVEAFYIPMRDGVRLAVDLHLPAELGPDDRLPTIVVSTRYWRKKDLRPGFKWVDGGVNTAMQFYVERGYAVLNIDVRGTGASFGTRRHEWDKEEVKDGWDIAAWIVSQPWSNEHIGGYGTSYSGTTAELLTVPNHPAVKAVVPRFNEFDVYTDIGFPGGLYLRGFVEEWSKANSFLDANRPPLYRLSLLERLVMKLAVRGVKPVDADGNKQLLKEAVSDHSDNIQASVLSQGIECCDDRIAAIDVGIDDYSVYRYQQQIEASGAAIYSWGGWFDAVTADGVIRRFLTMSNPQTAVIGAWNHSAGQHASPYDSHANNVIEHWQESLRFFNHYLKNEATGIEADIKSKTLYYFTMGEEKWKETSTWPPEGVKMQRWFMRENHEISQDMPDKITSADDYNIDFEVTTGKSNRWYTQMGAGPVIYPDRAEVDQQLLTYTSPPLANELEITGHPVISLYVASTAEDGAFFVYLEHVTPEGIVHYLTEGLLRAAHRKISTEKPPYVQTMPYHSYKRKDMQPLLPGEITELTFGLMPVSVLIPKGHRIRVAIAGADKDLFPRIPASGAATITVHRNQAYSSSINLPVMI